MPVIETFAGQSAKKYSTPNPDLAQFGEAIGNHSLLPDARKIDVEAYGPVSFGMFSALVASGSLKPQVARFVMETRRRIIEATELKWAETGVGRTAMATVARGTELVNDLVNKTGEVYSELARSLGSEPTVFRTNNYGSYQVIGGSKVVLEKLVELPTGARVVLLDQINGAHHCAARNEDVSEFAKSIKEISFADPRRPIIASTEPRPLITGEEVKEETIESLGREVDLIKMIQEIKKFGVTHGIDCGPGDFISKFVGRHLPVFSVDVAVSELQMAFEGKRAFLEEKIVEFLGFNRTSLFPS
jgi:malonyl CoA-acyl carrier protein transacylase